VVGVITEETVPPGVPRGLMVFGVSRN
jgi:hypothetical protein